MRGKGPDSPSFFNFWVMTLKFTYQIINNLKFNFFLLFSHPFSLTLLQHLLTLTKYNQSHSRSDHCVILLLVTVLSLSLSLSLSLHFFFFTKADRLLLHLYIKSVNAQTLICTIHLVCSTHTVHQAFSFIFFLCGFVCVYLSLFFLIFIIYTYIYNYIDLTNSYNIFPIIWQYVLLISLFFSP